MSKYLAFSLMVVTMVIGIIGGYAVSIRAPKKSQMDQSISALTTPTPMADESGTYTDQKYLSEMIGHHENAVEMSTKVLKHTSRKEIRTLATGIIEAQTSEIVQMRQWLVDWQ